LLGMALACSSEQEKTATENQQHKALYKAVNQPLEKAKGVEQLILDGAEQQRKQIDEQ